MKLVYRSPKEADEAGISYLARIAQRNGFGSVNVLRKHFYHSGLPDSGTPGRPGYWIQRLVHGVEAASGLPLSDPMTMHTPQMQTPKEVRYARVCPQCWSEAPYHRAYWRFAAYEKCHRHGLNLVSGQEDTYGQYRSSNQWLKGQCYYDGGRAAIYSLAELIRCGKISFVSIGKRAKRDWIINQYIDELEAILKDTQRPFETGAISRRILSGGLLPFEDNKDVRKRLCAFIADAIGIRYWFAEQIFDSWIYVCLRGRCNYTKVTMRKPMLALREADPERVTDPSYKEPYLTLMRLGFRSQKRCIFEEGTSWKNCEWQAPSYVSAAN